MAGHGAATSGQERPARPMRWWRSLRVRTGPRVLDAQVAEVHVEGDEKRGAAEWPERVAIIAHWAPSARVDRSASELTRAIVRNGYEAVFVSAAPSADSLEWSGGRPERVTVLRRPNVGYDFGSWATALDRYPAIAKVGTVLLVNDSLAGPFGPIDHLLERLDRTDADVWALTDTTQFAHHLQSYCLGFRRGALDEAPVARFWRNVRVETSREAVIWRNEIGLSQLLQREHFVTDAAFPHWRVVSEHTNPTIIGWRRLLDLGFPFVKRQLLREPNVAPDAGEIPAELQRRFDVTVEDWM
jgi:lipopolysaccharide biosynthesis protein